MVHKCTDVRNNKNMKKVHEVALHSVMLILTQCSLQGSAISALVACLILTCPNLSIANMRADESKIFAIIYVGVFERLQNLFLYLFWFSICSLILHSNHSTSHSFKFIFRSCSPSYKLLNCKFDNYRHLGETIFASIWRDLSQWLRELYYVVWNG